MKATTTHSFKGWEGRALVVHFSGLDDDQRLAAAYAALTRLKRTAVGAFLTVVCDWPPAAGYGASWPSTANGADGTSATSEVPEELEDFDPQWRPLIALLGDDDGLSVEPGEEVMVDGRVVDLDLATVRRGTRVLRLIDATRESALSVRDALATQGWATLLVRPDAPGQAELVRQALEG